MKYYIAKNGKHEGPFTIEEMKFMHIGSDTLVWNQELVNWTPAGNVPELCEKLQINMPYQSHNGQYQQYHESDYQYDSISSYQNNSGYNTNYGVCPKTWLLESILVTIFCCLPFGIVGIVKASQVETNFNSGNYDGALKSSKEAGKWTKLGFFIGLAGVILYILFYVLLFIVGFGAGLENY